MNEKIKQLSEQANIHFSRLGMLDGDPNGIAKFVSYSKFEKFAELIIKETLQVARAGIEYGDSMEDAVYTYFGVEE